MKRLILVGTVACGTALLARRAACSCGGMGFEKMIERMPESAPPKWMFRNIGAIRENTEQILRLLETERTPAAGQHVGTAA